MRLPIEAYVAGDVVPPPDVAIHLRTCVRCEQAWALASRIQQALVADVAATAPARFSDRVVQQTHRVQWWKAQDIAPMVHGAASSGALVAAGVAIWMSLGDGPLDVASLPVAVTAVALAIVGLGSMWSDGQAGADPTFPFSDLRPY